MRLKEVLARRWERLLEPPLGDVHVRRGPGYGLIIEPCTEDEIRHHVMDFAQSLLNPVKDGDDDEASAGSSPGISREIDRALRSMTGLRLRRSERKPDGSIVPPSDDARDLAASMPNARALAVESADFGLGQCAARAPSRAPGLGGTCQQGRADRLGDPDPRRELPGANNEGGGMITIESLPLLIASRSLATALSEGALARGLLC